MRALFLDTIQQVEQAKRESPSNPDTEAGFINQFKEDVKEERSDLDVPKIEQKLTFNDTMVATLGHLQDKYKEKAPQVIDSIMAKFSQKLPKIKEKTKEIVKQIEAEAKRAAEKAEAKRWEKIKKKIYYNKSLLNYGI